ncbi:MAG TPA: hypothetical protein VI756_21835 [Blastocatellia bacterium]
MTRILFSLLFLFSPGLIAGQTASPKKTKTPAKHVAAKHPAKRGAKVVGKRPAKPAAPASAAAPEIPPIVGSQILLMTKDGKRVSGQVVDITALAVQVKSDAGTSAVPLASITSMSFGADSTATQNQNPRAARHPNFTREVQSVLSSFQEMEKAIEGGPDYTGYGRELTELRRPVEHFLNKYAASEDETEARAAALLAAAITDFTWARTVWTLKLGRSGTVTVSASDSPVIADALDLYPDLRPPAGTSGVAADKLIGGLWKKAVENVDRTGKLVSQ